MLERKTTVSNKVITILEKSSSPLSVAQILVLLAKKDLHPNKTTVYRILEKLIAKGNVIDVSLKNGTTYYELSCGHHHNHHFICNECDVIYCLPTCHVEALQLDVSTLLPNPRFKLQTHDLNLYGVCDTCATH